MNLVVNIGEKDRKIRLAGALSILVLAIFNNSLLLLAISAYCSFTGWKRSCPIYTIAKINTLENNNNKPQ